jgi:hypothetical protein
MAKISHLIEKSKKLGLINCSSFAPHPTESEIQIKLASEGIDFIDNPTDFLKVFLANYKAVSTFLLGLISPVLLYLLAKLPSFIIAFFATHHINF